MDMRHKARPGSGTAHRPAYEVGAYTLDTFRVLCRVCNTGRSTRPDRIRALPHISRDLLLAAPACCAWPTGASGAVWVAEPFLRASGACAVAAGQERWRLPQAVWCAGFAVVQVLARPGCAVSPLPPAHPALDEAMLNAGRGARPGPPPPPGGKEVEGGSLVGPEMRSTIRYKATLSETRRLPNRKPRSEFLRPLTRFP